LALRAEETAVRLPWTRRHPGGSEPGQILTLDGLRGLAILGVLFHHQTLLPLEGAGPALDLWFARLFHVGWCGVDLFFVLSGFLITGLLLDAKGDRHYFRNFYARRTLRIFPLYYAVVFFSLIILPNLPAGLVPPEKVRNFGRIDGDELWYWTYLSNFAVAAAGQWRHGILDISWSLAIEEQFYLMWPLVVASLGRTALLRVCIGLVLLAPLSRLALHLGGASSLAVYVLTPARIDTLAIGAFLAIASRAPGGLARLLPAARGIGAALALALVVWFVAGRGLDPLLPGFLVGGFSLVALAFGALLVMTVSAQPGSLLHAIFASPVLRAFGKYSYALYLFHLPLRALVRDAWFTPASVPALAGSLIPGQILFYAVSTAVAFGAAVLSWYAYESRFLALKRFFPRSSSPPTPEPARRDAAESADTTDPDEVPERR
jgi:peptidoglycan/LPS O-acetylase OafA/YrhL